jgi:enoyl-CoA hydratase/carnithine racemase
VTAVEVPTTQILVESRDEVLIVTLDRPNSMNAWTPTMSQELVAVFDAANHDASVGAIVVRGSGRGFCSGADIGLAFGAHVDSDHRPEEPAPDPATSGWVTLCRQSKPLVAAIHGACVGVGLSMVLPFDHLVAASDAKLSARFVKMGLVPELASSHFLVSRCGWGRASWLALSGAMVSGDEAAAMGLVDRSVSADSVFDVAVDAARELAGNPPEQVRVIKGLLTANAVESNLDEVQRRELRALHAAYSSPDHREAVAAFLEKRPPRFR